MVACKYFFLPETVVKYKVFCAEDKLLLVTSHNYQRNLRDYAKLKSNRRKLLDNNIEQIFYFTVNNKIKSIKQF